MHSSGSNPASGSGSLKIQGQDVSTDFRQQVESLSGEKIANCYQCGECTAGCPAAFAMDIAPNRVMRMVQVGMADDVLESSSIWLCAGCETCATRCPKEVHLSKVMDALRQIAVKNRSKLGQENIARFHKLFLSEVQKNGRVHEMSLIGRFKIESGKLFNDIPMGMSMFMKGKLPLLPSKIKGVSEVKKLFRKK